MSGFCRQLSVSAHLGDPDTINYNGRFVENVEEIPDDQAFPVPMTPSDPDHKTFAEMELETANLQVLIQYWLTHIHDDPFTEPTRNEIERLAVTIGERFSAVTFIRDHPAPRDDPDEPRRAANRIHLCMLDEYVQVRNKIGDLIESLIAHFKNNSVEVDDSPPPKMPRTSYHSAP